jgi:hypothetical protein
VSNFDNVPIHSGLGENANEEEEDEEQGGGGGKRDGGIRRSRGEPE